MSIQFGGPFGKSFSFEFQVVMDSLSATFGVTNPTLSSQSPSWLCAPSYTYFDKSNACHEKEGELYDSILEDAINTSPVPGNYYIVDYNVEYDKVFGEDNDRTFVRKFAINTQFDLPTENENISIFGIEGLDSFHIHVSMSHFSVASTYSGETSAQFTSYKPKPGDIFQASYSELYYEILHVKKTVEQFLQRTHSWDFLVRPYRDLHFNLGGEVSNAFSPAFDLGLINDPISEFVDQEDFLEINDYIDVEAPSIIITSADDIANGNSVPNNPFGGW